MFCRKIRIKHIIDLFFVFTVLQFIQMYWYGYTVMFSQLRECSDQDFSGNNPCVAGMPDSLTGALPKYGPTRVRNFITPGKITTEHTEWAHLTCRLPFEKDNFIYKTQVHIYDELKMRLQPQSGIYCKSNNQEVIQLMTNQMKCVHNIDDEIKYVSIQTVACNVTYGCPVKNNVNVLSFKRYALNDDAGLPGLMLRRKWIRQ